MRAQRGEPFTADERAALLARYFAACRAAEAAELVRPERDAAAFQAEMTEVARAYVDAVSIIPVARSPFTGEVFETSLDTSASTWMPHGADRVAGWVAANGPGPILKGMNRSPVSPCG